MAGMLPRYAEALSLAIFGLALSCQREAPPVAQEAKAPTAGTVAAPSPSPSSAPAADAPAPAPAAAADGPGKNRYDETSFALTLEPSGEYTVGKEGAVTLTLKAAPPYKVNDQYPHKFKAKEGGGVKYAAAVVGKDKAKLDKQSLTMPVAFSAEAPGKVTVAGQFLFSVCTDENCLMEKRDLALTVDVK
jgi:hypothetical protein